MNWLDLPNTVGKEVEDLGLRIGSVHHSESMYGQVIDFVSCAYSVPPDWAVRSCDAYSSIFVAVSEAGIQATLSFTAAKHGELDCERFYPQSILKAYREVLYAPYRVAAKGRFPSRLVTKLLGRVVWAMALQDGQRLAIANANKDFAPVYVRSGYLPIAGTTFCHPRRCKDHLVFLMPADASRRTWFSDLFQAVDNTLFVHDICNCCGYVLQSSRFDELQSIQLCDSKSATSDRKSSSSDSDA